MRKFSNWIEEKWNDSRRVEDIEAEKLNLMIGNYLLTITKADGSDYEPDSLTSIHRSIER